MQNIVSISIAYVWLKLESEECSVALWNDPYSMLNSLEFKFIQKRWEQTRLESKEFSISVFLEFLMTSY
jgi:hypothetical protein